MKKKYIAPEILIMGVENGNLLQASPNIGYDKDGNFDNGDGGETIENGGEWNGATPAKGHSGNMFDWDSGWDF